MSHNISVEIQMFGMFKKFQDDRPYIFKTPDNITLKKIRELLQKELEERYPDFDHKGLLNDSVFSNDHTILKDSETIGHDTKLSILPPVCGG